MNGGSTYLNGIKVSRDSERSNEGCSNQVVCLVACRYGIDALVNYFKSPNRSKWK
jgi:hypothetical protein